MMREKKKEVNLSGLMRVCLQNPNKVRVFAAKFLARRSDTFLSWQEEVVLDGLSADKDEVLCLGGERIGVWRSVERVLKCYTVFWFDGSIATWIDFAIQQI